MARQRRIALCVAVLALLAASGVRGQSAWQPDKAVEFVIPTAAGGNNDKVTRLVQGILQERKLVTVPIVVLNKPGGSQTVAVVYASQRQSDPHHVLFMNPTLFTNELSGITQRRYTDLTPLALLLVENTALSVRAGSPLKGMRELVRALKSDPESLSFAMPSRGGVPHLTVAAAVKAAGLDPRKLKVVVFKGSGESMTSLLGGHVDVMVSSVGSVVAQMQAGNVRVLGIGAAQRLTGSLAPVPTFRDQGIDSTGVAAWRGFFGPQGLAPAHIAFWDDALTKMSETPEWTRNLEESDLTPQFLRSREFSKYLATEYAATQAVMLDLGFVQ
jgi:putative tricarboxylic transport membrane protein